MSDAAAHIAFSHSSWLEVFRWVFLKRPGKRAWRRICKRAALALLLRSAVIAMDLAILVLSLPHPINLFEEYLGGYSDMSFKDVPTLVELESVREAINSPSKPNNFMYADFKPTATRKVCYSGRYLGPDYFNRTKYLHYDTETNDVYDVGINPGALPLLSEISIRMF